jgi:hypothetical protein
LSLSHNSELELDCGSFWCGGEKGERERFCSSRIVVIICNIKRAKDIEEVLYYGMVSFKHETIIISNNTKNGLDEM